ncbi:MULTISPECIES: lipocalin-like domain-containing protein [unclassified Streptomyces]|uniref:lipocalin-like domain-containing protein n=1 Tax=unclassified Streptomyces TaxID=2593676 RepID=UPI002251238F|nr:MULTISPECIES: lipocalin-like domain-containing protein [unclassified Streptomyces]MCX4406056.1 lipocalin-like domain-containing protein [Streptomyces sp. NBC_01764]MCX5189420.1 lipocalin-like domain-containing protein [Streptomyces sp. NBC_00268]
MNAAHLRERLIGAWRLVSYETRRVSDGSVEHPFGKDALGLILYTQDGYMSAQLMARGAQPFDQADLHRAGNAELAQAARHYLAYSGPFEVSEDGRLTHHMSVSLFPNWLGQTQERVVTLTERLLRLTTTAPVLSEGHLCEPCLTWERI